METVGEFFSEYWLVITICGFLLLFFLPWLFVWQYRRSRKALLVKGRPARAKVLDLAQSGLTIGSGSENMRGIRLHLEVYPDDEPPYRVTIRKQVHLFDIAHITPGMMVAVRVDPSDPKKLEISHWHPAEHLTEGAATIPAEQSQAQRLKTLKEMLAAGLITSQDYEAKKAAILAEL